jgi:hypothetical protein
LCFESESVEYVGQRINVRDVQYFILCLQSLQVLASQGLAQVQNQAQAQEAGHYSDTTASAGGSDDEGSTAATDGSTLRTSPAEQVKKLLEIIAC